MSPRIFAITLLAAGLPALLARERSAAAQARPSAEQTSTLVQVYVAGSAETVARTRVSVQELVARLNLPTVVRDAAGADEALLRRERSAAMVNAYVDLRSLEAPRVIVADGASGEVLERRMLPPASSTETAVEAVAHVLYMTIESVLRTRDEERRKEAPRDAPAETPAPEPAQTPTADEPPPAPPRRSPSSSAAWGASASAFAAVTSLGPSRLLAGAGVGAEAAPRGFTVRPGVLGSFAMYAPGEVGESRATGSVHAMSARLLPFVEWAAAPRLTLHAGGGMGVDVLRFDSERPPPGAVSLGTASSTDLVVTTMAGARIALSRSLGVVAGLGIDVDVTPRRYVVEYGPVRESVFNPSQVRPHALLGLEFSVVGTPRFGGRAR